MSGKSYSEKLLDIRWQRVKHRIQARANLSCELCGNEKETVHVHHKAYRSGAEPWDYADEELLCVCETCHRKLHHIEKAAPPPRYPDETIEQSGLVVNAIIQLSLIAPAKFSTVANLFDSTWVENVALGNLLFRLVTAYKISPWETVGDLRRSLRPEDVAQIDKIDCSSALTVPEDRQSSCLRGLCLRLERDCFGRETSRLVSECEKAGKSTWGLLERCWERHRKTGGLYCYAKFPGLSYAQ